VPDVTEYALDYTEFDCACREALVEQDDAAVLEFYDNALFRAADDAEFEIDEDDYDYSYEDIDDFYHWDLP
jgi:hypothetical protein